MQIDTSSKATPTPTPKENPMKTNKAPTMTDEEYKKSRCNHGPKGKCTNCMGVT